MNVFDIMGATVSLGLVGLIGSVFVYAIDKITDDNYIPKNKRKLLKNKIK